MESLDGFTLIESVKKFRADDVPYALKVLQNTHDKKVIPRWFDTLESAARSQFIQRSIECYLQIISSARLARGFFKILTDLPKDYQDQIKRELERSFEALINDVKPDSVKRLCELLNVSPTAKEACQKFIIPTSNLIAEKLSLFTHASSETKGRQDSDTLYYAMKICIYCLQTCSETIKACLSKTGDGSYPTSNELQLHWSKTLHCLSSLLFQNTNHELLGLIATAISMMLNLSSSLSEASSAYRDIIKLIFAEKETVSIFHTQLKKPSTNTSPEDKDLCALMFIKGLLMTGSKELFCGEKTDEQSLIFFLFPYILKPCKGCQIHHYVAFQVLALWFQKLKVIGIDSFPKQSDNSDINEDLKPCDCDISVSVSNKSDITESTDVCDGRYFMSSSCQILTSTLSTIWLNWESPVDGVSEYVTTILDSLLNIWALAVEDGISSYSQLSNQLMERVLIMSWHTKTRYRPLCILLQHVDVAQLLREHPELKEDLVKCMGVNSLAAVASDVYKAFLTQIKIQAVLTETDVVPVWSECWMQTLLNGISSSISIQRMKICTYWIPHSLKIIKGSDVALLDTLQSRIKSNDHTNKIQNLLAWTTVCRYTRDILGITLQEQHYSYVKEALVCIDEDVRAEALFLLCNTLKRATPVSHREIELLKSFITFNLKTDSASFRQNIVSALKKLVARVRDSCLSEVRLQKLSSDILTNGIDFIDWLYNTLLQNLYPGGSYQCRQTILDLLEATLSLLVFKQQNYSKKGKAHEGSDILVECAKDSGKWMFFSQQNFLILLSCLEDGSDDIQTQCFRLLVEFFPWPNSSQWKNAQDQSGSDSDVHNNSENSLIRMLSHKETVCNLINKALNLASSPKSYETHSGLLLTSLVLKKYVENVGLIFEFNSQCRVTDMCVHDENSSAKQCRPSYAFLDMLMQFLEASVSAAKKDPAAHFKFHPIHGLTQYATQCLKGILGGSDEEVKNKVDYLERLKDLNKVIINLMLEVLSGGGNLDQCPSFAEMGVALESLVSGDDENQENVTTLSPDFQLLLSWCWINLKESCTSLGQVTASSLKGDKCLLSRSDISDIGEVFVRVLTTCRHRGAIEGCRSGFSMFCGVLLSCKDEEYSSIPKSMVTTIVQSLLSNSLTASISRRSAGLPIIVEIVTDQVIKICNDKQFLKSTVDEFYSIASQPFTSDHSQQRDLSQVHAFNILKVVFCDANLASHLGPLLSKLTILVIKNFDSPSWAIRNSATQLISTLVMRIFGQRNKSSGSMTLEEFNSLHPELVDYIVLKLQDLSSAKNVINPSLYVLLTLLSNLVMSPSHLHNFENRKVLHSMLFNYLENPVHSLRNLSAKALVALFELDRADEEVTKLLRDIIFVKQSVNSLHGHLLCLYHLVCSDAVSASMCQKTLEFFCDNKVLFSPSSTCFLPSTQVALIVQKLVQRLPGGMPTGVRVALWSCLENLFSLLCKSDDRLQAGAASCMRECFVAMTLIVTACRDLHAAMAQFVCSAITSTNSDIRETVISTLHTEPFQECTADSSIQETLLQNLVKESSSSIFVQSCDILYRLCDKKGQMSDSPEDLSAFCGEGMMEKWSHIDSVKSSILMLQGIAYDMIESSELQNRCGTIKQWCDAIVHFGRPFMNENFRLSAARALRKGGAKVLGVCNQNASHDAFGSVAVSIVKAALQFLEDSETLVRNEASIFVSGLVNVPHVHSNLALHMLSQYITQNMCCSGNMYAYLLDQLYVHGDLTTECKNVFSSELQRLFEPDLESILLELHAKKVWAFNVLKILSEDQRSEFLGQLKLKSSEATEELNENFTKLALDLEGFVFNVSNKPKAMASLLGMVLLDTLCQGQGDSTSIADGLHGLVKDLLKVPYLHPLIRPQGMESLKSTEPVSTRS